MAVTFNLKTVEAGQIDQETGDTTLVGLSAEGEQLNLQTDFKGLQMILGTLMNCIPDLTLATQDFKTQVLGEGNFGLSFNLIGESWLTVVMGRQELEDAFEAIAAVLNAPARGGSSAPTCLN